MVKEEGIGGADLEERLIRGGMDGERDWQRRGTCGRQTAAANQPSTKHSNGKQTACRSRSGKEFWAGQRWRTVRGQAAEAEVEVSMRGQAAEQRMRGEEVVREDE